MNGQVTLENGIYGRWVQVEVTEVEELCDTDQVLAVRHRKFDDDGWAAVGPRATATVRRFVPLRPEEVELVEYGRQSGGW